MKTKYKRKRKDKSMNTMTTNELRLRSADYHKEQADKLASEVITTFYVPFSKEDAVELFHIIQSRGCSQTRVKLLDALIHLDPTLASTIEKTDDYYQSQAEKYANARRNIP